MTDTDTTAPDAAGDTEGAPPPWLCPPIPALFGEDDDERLDSPEFYAGWRAAWRVAALDPTRPRVGLPTERRVVAAAWFVVTSLPPQPFVPAPSAIDRAANFGRPGPRPEHPGISPMTEAGLTVGTPDPPPDLDPADYLAWELAHAAGLPALTAALTAGEDIGRWWGGVPMDSDGQHFDPRHRIRAGLYAASAWEALEPHLWDLARARRRDEAEPVLPDHFAARERVLTDAEAVRWLWGFQMLKAIRAEQHNPANKPWVFGYDANAQAQVLVVAQRWAGSWPHSHVPV